MKTELSVEELEGVMAGTLKYTYTIEGPFVFVRSNQGIGLHKFRIPDGSIGISFNENTGDVQFVMEKQSY